MRRIGSSGAGREASRSMDQRNAASVLPDPVGATTRACDPFCTASHAPVCAAVGPGKAPWNHSRVAGEKRARTGSICSSSSAPPTSAPGPTLAGRPPRRPGLGRSRVSPRARG
ncbi:hypothetical protein [Clavibacter tessellarius]|uniref:hypothetical protein n=1 Tax=Clavibacter tessellarius TaxID=31965 RepID=UPI0032560E17